MNTEKFLKPVEEMIQAVEKLNLNDKKTYGNYLAQTFYYVSHSTRLLAFAAGLMERKDESHFRRFIRHIAEESAHEVLAEKDLKDLGMKPEDFLQLPETRALWESQYYKVLHESPISFMGYIIALEYFASSYLPKLLERVESIYKGQGRRFIKLHAEEDPDHIVKALELTASLTEQEQELIYINLAQTAQTYSRMVEACEKHAHVSTVQSLMMNEAINSVNYTFGESSVTLGL